MESPNEPKPPSKPSNTTPFSESSSSSVETTKSKENSSNERDDNHQKQRKTKPFLDLSLCTNDSDQGFDREGDHPNIFNVENPPNSDKSPQGNEAEQRVFSCNYCQRKFYSSQALGGHQNAHKRERTLAKRGQRISSTAFGNYYSDQFYKNRPFSSLPSTLTSSYPSNISALPLYGSYNNNHSTKNNHRHHLGIQAHSLIHKPTTHYLGFSSNGSSHHGWSRMPMIDQQPGIGRLGMVSLLPSSSSSNGGVARFDSVQKNSQPLDRSTIGGVCWKGSSNVLRSSNKQLQDHDQLHKLDLSLKL